MFIGGKNEDPNSETMATAYIAYDCRNEILVSSYLRLLKVPLPSLTPILTFDGLGFLQCAAGHLNADYMAEHPDVYVVEDDDESWIRLGGNASDPKLKSSVADEFAYVMKPPDDAYTIGYEGCWNISGLGASVINNFVEVSLSINMQLHC